MHVIGLIAEYNPFHKGHLYQINKIKEKYPNSLLVVVTSSSFTQRGNISLLNKWDKTKIALENNVDLVVELPFVYSTQSSDLFAEGAISILNTLKIDTLVFGTERDNISDLELLADIQINNIEYQDKVKEYLSQGLNYATSTNKALEDLTSINRMNRLVQGDVGSGKTIVAITALYINYLSGYQGALMAPTEVLA